MSFISSYMSGRRPLNATRPPAFVLALAGLFAATSTVAHRADAQSVARPEFRIGIGTFLTRDRGWNYAESMEIFAAVSRRVGAADLLAGVSAFKTFAEFVSPAVFPPPPSSLTDGFSARFHVRFPSTARSSVGAIAGTEIIHDRTPRHPRTTTVAGAAGVAFNVGRAELGLRYVAFAGRLGSSRGTLPLSVAWRL